jgi:mRNA interferase YafQ
MRTIERSTAFKRDYKRVKATPRYRKTLDMLLSNIITLLLEDKALPDNNYDHSLGSNWSGFRECHVKPDLLLIYKKPDPSILKLARLGSHSELFG